MIQKKPLKNTALIFTFGTLRNLKLTKVQEKKDRISTSNLISIKKPSSLYLKAYDCKIIFCIYGVEINNR